MNEHEIDKSVLANMLTGLAQSFRDERQQETPYKELFIAGSTHTGLLRELSSKMTSHVLDACDIYKERHGIEINKKQYYMLLALPLLVEAAEKDAKDNDGIACHVDKAYFILSEQLKALSDHGPEKMDNQS